HLDGRGLGHGADRCDLGLCGRRRGRDHRGGHRHRNRSDSARIWRICTFVDGDFARLRGHDEHDPLGSEKENPDTYYPHGRAEFDEPAFARVIKDTDSEVLRCYREARRYNPKLRGVVMAEMTVTPDGTIATAEVTDSSLEDRGVENCVKRLVRDLTFPRGVTSRPARVTYSWQLRPDAG
ncbi:MAG: AgmX/PglI C-terminal domain-containing protein, partial [Myxococcota bacterium]